MPRYTAAEVAQKIGGTVTGDPEVALSGFAAADGARPGDLTFAENETYFQRAAASAASAILVAEDHPPAGKTLIRVPNARVGFAQVLPLFFPDPVFPPGVHLSAVVAATAEIDPAAHVGPLCCVGDRVRIGPRAVLHSGVHVGDDCQIGEGAHLMPRVTLYPRTICGKRVRIHAGAVIGADGFGYVFDQGAHRKIPQVGHVVLHDDVEIGANTTIDRAALGSTVVGKGVKIDNLVQVAHNVVIGEHSILVAQVGIAGSTKIGNYVTIAGQAAVAGHLRIGDRAIIMAQAGVMNHVPEGEKWLGAPAQPHVVMKRQWLAIARVPDLLRRVQELERRLGMGAAPAKPDEA
jgi:UDP-3-O-[3-hydroxymyristoyl] glucosamine N-acyltransferase